MSQSQSRRPLARSVPLRARIATCLFLVVGCATVHAQSTAPAAAVPGGDSSASERAKREGDKVFQWIRVHSDKPRKSAVAAATAAAPAAPVAAARTAKPAGKASDGGITETVTPLAGRADTPRETTSTAAPGPAGGPAEALLASAAPKAQPVEEDMVLVPIRRTEPEFSTALMRSLRKGLVQVSFTVLPDGTVNEAHAVSSTHSRLKEVAVATVSQWRFQPLHHAQRGVVDLGFNLEE